MNLAQHTQQQQRLNNAFEQCLKLLDQAGVIAECRKGAERGTVAKEVVVKAEQCIEALAERDMSVTVLMEHLFKTRRGEWQPGFAADRGPTNLVPDLVRAISRGVEVNTLTDFVSYITARERVEQAAFERTLHATYAKCHSILQDSGFIEEWKQATGSVSSLAKKADGILDAALRGDARVVNLMTHLFTRGWGGEFDRDNAVDPSYGNLTYYLARAAREKVALPTLGEMRKYIDECDAAA